MSLSSSKSHSDQSATALDFNALLSREAYLTSLDDFLKEPVSSRALEFWLREFVSRERLQSTDDIFSVLNQAIAAIDSLINDQLNLIIHHAKFKKLEASWRGLWYLAVQVDGVKNIKLKVLDVAWPEITKDIARAIEFDQSQLFQKIYSEEFGTPGGEPYGALIGDYEVCHKATKESPYDDIATLTGLAQIAAASFAPFITGASPSLFGLDDFSSLGNPLNLNNIFSQKEYIPWRSLRDKIDTRFLGLVLPHTLMRKPYRSQPGSYKGVYFYEKSIRKAGEHYLFGNAAYAFGSILIREFSNVGWFGHIRGVPRDQIGGGLITNLPVDCFTTDDGDVAPKPVTDVIITDNLERELSNHGFVPLCQCYATPFAAFYNNQSLQRPQKQTGSDVTVNAKLSAMLQHVLCGSRVAHYIKVMIRDKVGSFTTAEGCEDYLRKWLFKYTTGREDLEWEEQARYPLRESNVRVREHPERPGHYACVIHLVPHYQLDQMVSELELVTELVQSN